MVNIALGQSITGTFTTEDPSRSGYRLDQYDLTGFDDYRQLTIELTATNTTTPLLINLVDTITGNVVAVKEAAVNGQGKISLSNTIFPGSSYRLLVGGQSGTYTVSTVDGGRAISIVTPFTARNNGDGSKTDVGTVGQDGQFFSLASSNTNTDRFLLDIALGVDRTKLYAIGSNAQEQDILFKINPDRATGDQVTEIGLIRDSATNNVLNINLNSLAYGSDGQLYTIGSGHILGNNLYTVNTTTAVATSVRSNMPGDLVSGGDLVYDPAANRFLVASILFRPDGTRGSSLWSIPLATSENPTKIGNIGFPLVKGLSFENGQLKGFTGGTANAVGNRIIINTTTGIGTFENKIGSDAIAPINNGIGGATEIIISATTPPPTHNDFNGDQKSDILWRSDIGGVALWQMDGSTVISSSLTSTSSLDNSWTVAGTGDFNGDGKSDILWRNTNGNIDVWTMNGSTVISSSLTSTPSLDNSWTVAGTGDFNGDGKSDILWRNTNGNIDVWTMDGSIVTSSILTSTPSLDASWKVASHSDFNGDGKADILWRNDDGSVALWQMNGAAIAASTAVAKVATDWKIAGSGDFNNDSKADILWRNDNGAVALWQMDGSNITSRSLTSTPSLDRSWTVAGIGDYNGDGRSDISWRDTSGAVDIWQMSGATVTSSLLTSVAADGSSWKIAAPIL